MIIPNSNPIISEESVEDVNEEFDALVDNTDESISDNIVEHVDNIHEEFERLVEEVSEETPAIIAGNEIIHALNELDEQLHEESTPVTPIAIPTNNIDTLIDDTHARFSSAVWFDKVKQQRITIIGQGGIGSWSSLIVGRLGVSDLYTYDADVVESVNMAGQMFGLKDIGIKKCSAVHNRVYNLCDYFYFHAYSRNFVLGDYCSPITISALDNMNARKLVYNIWKSQYSSRTEGLFIDGRLSADEFQIFIIKPGDKDRMKEYETKWLFAQSEGEENVCSFKQTTYMATMIASFIGNVIVNYCANLANPDNMFDLPFFINYNAEMMYFKTVDL